MLNIVLTGATGYVGRAFLKQLTQLPQDSVSVRALVRKLPDSLPDNLSVNLSETSPDNLSGNLANQRFPSFVDCVEGSLPEVPDSLFFDAPHVLVHFGVKQIDHDSSGFEEVNVKGTQCLLDKTSKHTLGVIYGSTLSVQGQERQTNIHESAPLAPGTALAETRAQAEQIVCQAMKNINQWAFCLRPRFILGKEDQFVLPGFLKLANKGIFIGNGKQQYSVITVDDYAKIIVKLAQLMTQDAQQSMNKTTPVKQMAVNVGYQQPLSFEQIFSTLSDYFQINKKRFKLNLSAWLPKVLNVLPSKKLHAKATQLQLIGFDHFGDIGRLERLIGSTITQQNSVTKLKEILE